LGRKGRRRRQAGIVAIITRVAFSHARLAGGKWEGGVLELDGRVRVDASRTSEQARFFGRSFSGLSPMVGDEHRNNDEEMDDEECLSSQWSF
jgi:hypothetical protein